MLKLKRFIIYIVLGILGITCLYMGSIEIYESTCSKGVMYSINESGKRNDIYFLTVYQHILFPNCDINKCLYVNKKESQPLTEECIKKIVYAIESAYICNTNLVNEVYNHIDMGIILQIKSSNDTIISVEIKNTYGNYYDIYIEYSLETQNPIQIYTIQSDALKNIFDDFI